MTVSTTIAAGPSKFDLMLALFDRQPFHPRETEFKFDGPDEMSIFVVIDGIDLEDGSDEIWNFKGCARRMLPGGDCVPRRVAGWYHTDTQQGSIRIVD